MVDTATFTAVDLSRLPAPAIVEPLDFETILAQLRARLVELVPDFDATVESDPAVKLLELCAYRELLIRARVNDAARACMPAYAAGADLDNLAALLGVARLVLAPADPARGRPAVLESDDALRRRMILAPESFSVAGPSGAYIYHALTAAPEVLDASATSPAPGEVLVTILARGGDGAAAPALVARVADYLTAETRRPLTDHVTVRSATIIPFAITASLVTYVGPDSQIVLAAARARLDALLAEGQRLGRDLTRSALFAALHGPGVQNVRLDAPAADLALDATQAGFCTGVTLSHGGIAA
ncbi:baseplate assembly protein [Sphingomonas morindae]|uniref:Baseplate J/gp47 family protein n=1 Tax=Sphingomonas morindae TaxID=1541170 RepID=A0ABY4X742_9SPHN|nr:baseplate J/gp47 family protein [Sphingomonas morindae]USI72714.1 baseplate J/gp47 family protein [Sphingomonas morindae]